MTKKCNEKEGNLELRHRLITFQASEEDYQEILKDLSNFKPEDIPVVSGAIFPKYFYRKADLALLQSLMVKASNWKCQLSDLDAWSHYNGHVLFIEHTYMDPQLKKEKQISNEIAYTLMAGGTYWLVIGVDANEISKIIQVAPDGKVSCINVDLNSYQKRLADWYLKAASSPRTKTWLKANDIAKRILNGNFDEEITDLANSVFEKENTAQFHHDPEDSISKHLQIPSEGNRNVG